MKIELWTYKDLPNEIKNLAEAQFWINIFLTRLSARIELENTFKDFALYIDTDEWVDFEKFTENFDYLETNNVELLNYFRDYLKNEAKQYARKFALESLQHDIEEFSRVYWINKVNVTILPEAEKRLEQTKDLLFDEDGYPVRLKDFTSDFI